MENRAIGSIFAMIKWSRSSMDRMADSGSVGWAFESPRDHKSKDDMHAVFTVTYRAIRNPEGSQSSPLLLPHQPHPLQVITLQMLLQCSDPPQLQNLFLYKLYTG